MNLLNDFIYKNFKKKLILVFFYEFSFIFLLIASIIPDGMNLLDFMRNPIGSIIVNEISIGLTLILFVPFIGQSVKHFNFYGAKIEFNDKFDKIAKNIATINTEIKLYQDNQERLLYSILASIGRSMETQPRRLNKALQDIPLEIGMKNYPESKILAEIVHYFLSHYNIPVNQPTMQQNTLGNFFNLRSGKIDLYMEYSANGFMLSGKDVEEHNHEVGKLKINKLFENWDLEWLNTFGYDNQFEFVMQVDTARKYSIRTMTDLIDNSDEFVFGVEIEYLIRDSLFPRLERLAKKANKSLVFKDIREVSIGDRYDKLLEGELDVTVGWTCDPEMDKSELCKIEWDDNFPAISYYLMPLCRKDVVPDIKIALSQIKINEEQMKKMNLEAKKGGNTESVIKGVAAKFCLNLIKEINNNQY